jgi:hypothetical protein
MRRWRVEQQACHGQSSLQRDEGVVGRFRAARLFELANKRADSTICAPDGHLSKSAWYQKALGIDKTSLSRPSAGFGRFASNPAGNANVTHRVFLRLSIRTVSASIVDHDGDEGATSVDIDFALWRGHLYCSRHPLREDDSLTD